MRQWMSKPGLYIRWQINRIERFLILQCQKVVNHQTSFLSDLSFSGLAGRAFISSKGKMQKKRFASIIRGSQEREIWELISLVFFRNKPCLTLLREYANTLKWCYRRHIQKHIIKNKKYNFKQQHEGISQNYVQVHVDITHHTAVNTQYLLCLHIEKRRQLLQKQKNKNRAGQRSHICCYDEEKS